MKVKITDENARWNFGFEEGRIYEVVPSPERKFEDSVWVFSEERGEPARLLPHEYEYVN
jgi:hypothetical protein